MLCAPARRIIAPFCRAHEKPFFPLPRRISRVYQRQYALSIPGPESLKRVFEGVCASKTADGAFFQLPIGPYHRKNTLRQKEDYLGQP